MAYYFLHGLEILPKQPGLSIQLPELLHTQNKLQKGPECKVSQERKNLLQASLRLTEKLTLLRVFPSECCFTSKLFLYLQHPTCGSFQDSQGIGSTLPFFSHTSSGKPEPKISIFHWQSPLIFTD